jgi:H+/Cl- antiporter ClcA
MSTCILKLIRWKAAFTSKYQHVIYIVIAATLVALVAFFFDSSILGSGKELMTRTLFTPDKHVFWYTSIFRSVGPILSFSTGAAGGIFAPALSAGASIGALVAGWLQTSVTDTNLLILCGMVGFLTGVTRSPFTSAILVLEMTDRHSVIFYLMIAGTIASMVSYIIDRHSFYDHLKIQYLQEMHRE